MIFKCLFIFFLFFFSCVHAQESLASTNLRSKKILPSSLEVSLDTVSILPNSVTVFKGIERISSINYTLDYSKATIRFLIPPTDSVLVYYRISPIDFHKKYQLRDTSQLFSESKGSSNDFLQKGSTVSQNPFDQAGLDKSGSISRGISFGNQQDLSINSTLNLQLSGKIAPNLSVLASVTDDNLPIQPDGNTSKLQEFDQLFIRLFNAQFRANVGDFWISKPTGYFLNYKKRGQGLSGDYDWVNTKDKKINTQLSLALSKGKFNRQNIQSIEGNQGPYRLTGAENEPFITILSGTERVYINGKLLKRGQEFDYTIDYNTSELIFTTQNLMTKDERITVEFQYTDRNYARSMLQFSTSYTTKKLEWWINAFQEQDAKNQSLQQDLSNDQKFLMSNIGDNLLLAKVIAIDSIAYSENQILYQLKDSLGIDSVLVFSTNQNLAKYKAVFTFVGQGKGDYVLESYNALGKVYKWLQPVGGIPQGDFAPIRLLISPKKQTLFTAGAKWKPTAHWTISTELGKSTNDVNTFSRFDSKNDNGFSTYFKVEHSKKLKEDTVSKWNWINSFESENTHSAFKPIEQYRAVEFDRDWNTRNQDYFGNQYFQKLTSKIEKRKAGNLQLSAQNFIIGEEFQGFRAVFTSQWNEKNWKINSQSSFLSSQGKTATTSFRQILNISKKIKKTEFGYAEMQEHDAYSSNSIQLDPRSYSFYQGNFFLTRGDSSKRLIRFSAGQRYDAKSDSVRFKQAAKATNINGSILLNPSVNHRLTLLVNHRKLTILDSILIPQKPENTTNGRLEHDLKLFKNTFQFTTFYEASAGLEQKREFIYIKVNDGQGIYTWNDYNLDNIKDLNEFEIAAFVDQASYIRVFTPSANYIRTYGNEFNHSITIRPERIWASAKNWKKQIARFSWQTRFRLQSKTNEFEGINSYNPFLRSKNDSSLISSNGNQKHTIYFNRNSTKFGVDASYSLVNSKTLLATGFDGKINETKEMNLRWMFLKEWTFLVNAQLSEKNSIVDYTQNRNYAIQSQGIKPSLQFQPSTSVRYTTEFRYINKVNSAVFGGESSEIFDLGLTLKYSKAQLLKSSGNFQAQLNYVQINYLGNSNSPVAFELLEALKPGKNVVWNVTYQRNISKNLQLSIQYSGRTNPASRTIHAGGMELRALF